MGGLSGGGEGVHHSLAIRQEHSGMAGMVWHTQGLMDDGTIRVAKKPLKLFLFFLEFRHMS
jgi:hypothetical protein